MCRNIKKVEKLFILALAANTCLAARAQKHIIKSKNIASLQVVAGKNWLSMPITQLNGGDPINIAFDDLTHEYHRYAYKIEHCEADWSLSDGIFETDYCDGFANGNIIDDTEESINTNTLYTHYSFSIPNERCRLKISGNYKVTVYEENEGDTILTTCFMVVDPQMSVALSATSNTDIDTNKSHQQVEMSVDYANVKINNPERELKTVVLQNMDWNDARRNARPQFLSNNGIRWQHNKQLIFNGWNEYHKFEILDVSHPTLGIENVGWDGELFHAQIWTDHPRLNYTYDEDANGAFYIRNSDNIENDKVSEYVMVQFRLKAPRQPYDVYVDGVWTNGSYSTDYLMTYNELEEQYESRIMLKQGYYSYRYVAVDAEGKPKPVSTEGNFFQTENTYQALVYYRGIGQRTDLLVGYKEIKFK